MVIFKNPLNQTNWVSGRIQPTDVLRGDDGRGLRGGAAPSAAAGGPCRIMQATNSGPGRGGCDAGVQKICVHLLQQTLWLVDGPQAAHFDAHGRATVPVPAVWRHLHAQFPAAEARAQAALEQPVRGASGGAVRAKETAHVAGRTRRQPRAAVGRRHRGAARPQFAPQIGHHLHGLTQRLQAPMPRAAHCSRQLILAIATPVGIVTQNEETIFLTISDYKLDSQLLLLFRILLDALKFQR